MANPKPTSSNRANARNIVKYELCMFRMASRMWLDEDRPRDDAYLGSALLDSALLHTRSLLEFLTKYPNSDSVVARDFLDSDSDWKSSGLSLEKAYNKEINIFRSHISWARINSSWTWEDKLPGIVNDIETAFTGFIRALPDEEQSAWHIE